MKPKVLSAVALFLVAAFTNASAVSSAKALAAPIEIEILDLDMSDGVEAGFLLETADLVGYVEYTIGSNEYVQSLPFTGVPGTALAFQPGVFDVTASAEADGLWSASALLLTGYDGSVAGAILDARLIHIRQNTQLTFRSLAVVSGSTSHALEGAVATSAIQLDVLGSSFMSDAMLALTEPGNGYLSRTLELSYSAREFAVDAYLFRSISANVYNLATPVPEPSTSALLAGGLMALLIGTRLRRATEHPAVT